MQAGVGVTLSEQAPLVAVLLPVYGRDNPAHLDESLSSVAAQSYPKHQIRLYVAQDGPVSEAHKRVLAKHRDLIYEICEQPGPAGLAANLNNALSRVSGCKYVVRQDADDISVKIRLERQITYLEENPHIGILGSAIVEFDDSDRAMHRVRRYPQGANVRAALAKGSPLAHPSVVFRAEVLYDLGGYPIASMNEDLALWFSAAKRGVQIDNLEEPLVWFRVTAATAGRRGFEKATEEFRIYARGIIDLGLPFFMMVYPVARFAYRVMPKWLRASVFKMTSVRNWILR